MEYVLFVEDLDHVLAIYPNKETIYLEKPVISKERFKRKTIQVYDDGIGLMWHEDRRGSERCQQ